MHDHFLTSTLLHKFGKSLTIALFVTVVAALATSFRMRRLQEYKLGFFYVLFAAGISVAIAGLFKKFSGISCPWSLSEFGGSKEYFSIYDFHRPVNDEQCFPSGHASGGYTFIALYFFCYKFFPRWKWHGLELGMFLGISFGIAQQLRGAHFLSHDIWTLASCWFVSLGSYYLLLARKYYSPPPASGRS